MIKKFLIFAFLFTINIEKSIANDIRDFEIEGMSIGDSLLDHFTKKKITTSIVNWYDRLEKNKYFFKEGLDFSSNTVGLVMSFHGSLNLAISKVNNLLSFSKFIKVLLSL